MAASDAAAVADGATPVDGAARPVRTGPVPEFRVVVSRPHRRGPLAPYRLALAVVFALLVAGGRMWTALSTGQADDAALLVAAGAGLFVWIVTTIISSILAAGTPHPAPSRLEPPSPD